MKTTRILNCPFTTEELKEIGVKLALENQRKERLEDEKKQSQSQFKSEIDAADAKIKSLAQKLARGSEDREIECDVLFNTPEEGKKTIQRGDTGEVVSIQPMTESELNDPFVNCLGAQKDNGEFVFRDKSRAKMLPYAEYKKLLSALKKGEDGELEKIADGYTEEALVDQKPESLGTILIVYEIDPATKKDIFEVYRFIPADDKKPARHGKMIEAFDRKDTPPADAEIEDAEIEDEENADQEAGK